MATGQQTYNRILEGLNFVVRGRSSVIISKFQSTNINENNSFIPNVQYNTAKGFVNSFKNKLVDSNVFQPNVITNEEVLVNNNITSLPINNRDFVNDNVQKDPLLFKINGLLSDSTVSFGVFNTPISSIPNSTQIKNDVLATLLSHISQFSSRDRGYNFLMFLRDSGKPFTIFTRWSNFDVVIKELFFSINNQQYQTYQFSCTFQKVNIVPYIRSNSIANKGQSSTHPTRVLPQGDSFANHALIRRFVPRRRST